jgi:predicted metal-dependent hydrolase
MFLTNPEFENHVVVRRSRRARRLALRLDPKKRIFNLVVPWGMSLRKAHKFAADYQGWMQEKLEELAPAIPFRHGTILPVFGENIRLNITYDISLKITSIKLINNEIIVFTNQENPAPRIARFLKKMALERFGALAREKAEKIGKTVKSVSVRDTRSRWGSCAEDGALCFSWRLIFAPPAVIDYIVAHEVAHLRHLDHSKAFWALCRELSDDFVEGQYWLDNHGQDLMRYGQHC